jgi:sulfatase modifying factor 1
MKASSPRPSPHRLPSGWRDIVRPATAACLALAAVISSRTSAHAVTIDMVTVGDPGNAGNTNGYGDVAYSYRIGKYEVTIQQYTDFLNAVAADDTYSLYNTNMGTNLNIAGISRAGASGSYTYSVIGPSGTNPTGANSSGDRPISYISWFDAARFANWMHNGQPTGPQGNGTTETGAYTLWGAVSGEPKARNLVASFFIPSPDEWFKAGYYKGGGINAGYWLYPTQNNSRPTNVIGNGLNQANAYLDNRYSVTQTSVSSPSQNYLTNVGAFTASASPYGTFDQAGNVSELLESCPGAASKVAMAGGGYGWSDYGSYLQMGNYSMQNASDEFSSMGFRLASPVAVPEPSTWVMGLAGIACGGWGAYRRRKRSPRSRVLTATASAVAFAAVLLAAAPAYAVTIDWVTVGNPGNMKDPNTGNTYGTVSDSFRIMKFEWTNSQYVMFLNAVDPQGTNPNSIWDSSMGSDARGGISLVSGNANGSKYAVRTNMGAKPVNYVSWFDAARVANWLHHGAQSYGSSDSTASAPQNIGAYTLGTLTSGAAPAKNSNAQYYIPTENQWYKAAYFKGIGNDYGIYGNGYSTTPTVVSADTIGVGSAGSNGNAANYSNGADWNGQDGNVTTVGSNGASSFYGAFDMSGNVMEWNDLAGSTDFFRGLRDGSWGDAAGSLSSANHATIFPSFATNQVGFRLASPVAVPEPSTWAMGLAGIACGGWHAYRRRKKVTGKR